MTTKKNLKTHTSTRKKSSTPSSTSSRTRTKASKITANSKAAKKREKELADRKKLAELTLKMFQMVYEDYQQGKFHRIL